MNKLLLVSSLLILSLSTFAQMVDREFNQKFLEANQLMEEKLWNKSIDLWTELTDRDNDNTNVKYKLAFCYMNTANRKLESLPLLKEAAYKKISKKYDPFDPNEKKAPVEAIYYLGRAYHLNYEMDLAIAEYERLMSTIPKRHYLHKEAQHQIDMCNQAKYQVANPQNYLISNVGPVINQASNEYSPILSLDESAMFFTSRRLRGDSSNVFISDIDTGEHKEDIYVSYKDQSGNWMTPELLNINTDAHAASVSVSPDGQTLYLYYDEEGDGQLWKSVLIGETWSEPEKLGSDINSDAWETHVTISADGNTLYFTSNREDSGGYGGRDIYRCVKLPTDEWSKALNVGATLNTEYEEDSPFLSADGNTLYFASSGHSSMGGFDIFYSTLGEDGEWSTPQNIGYPLNTTDDDVFFVPTASGKRAYYSSRKEEGLGLKDIYVIDMPDSPIETDLAVLKGYIYAPEGMELPDDVLVLVTNRETGDVTEYRPRQRDGAYVSILPPCVSYKIEYFVNSDLISEEFINVPCESAYTEIEKEIFLLPIHLEGEGEVEAGIETEDPVVVNPPVDDSGEPLYGGIVDGGLTPKTAVGTTFVDGVAYFQRYFIYDFHEFGVQEKLFEEFIDNVESLIVQNDDVTILVESSASNVPSSRFKNNQELTKFRNKTARDQIADELKKRGYKKNSDYKFEGRRELVQGKKYQNDAQTNKKTYELYQYIKIWVESSN